MQSVNERASLVGAALGSEAPDLAICGGNLVNVHTREMYPADIVIKGNRVAAVEEPNSRFFGETPVIQADGQTIVPGFIDPHIHLESSAVTLSEYTRITLPRGVTTVAEDPHEIANVLGIEGFKLFLEEARNLPIRFLLRVPGRVPGIAPGLETSGGEITLEQTKELLEWEEAVCLAGDINPNLLLQRDKEQLEKIAYAIELKKTVSGQSPGLQGAALNAFVAAGPEDSHVSENAAEVLDILRHGLRALITHRQDLFQVQDYEELAKIIGARQMDTRLLCFCSDDVLPHFLLEQGSLDARIRLAIQHGLDPLTAIQMATINVADFLRLDRDLGSITPGKLADIVILDDLEAVKVDKVLCGGKVVAERGALVQRPPRFEYPAWSRSTIHLRRPVRADDLPIRVTATTGKVKVRVIQLGMPKQEIIQTLNVAGEIVQPAQDRDILSVAVLDRHRKSGGIGKGFVTGTGIKNGAIASTVSHDAHNVFVIGTDFKMMELAANHLASIGGGHVAVQESRVVAQVELPIAGLMSEEPIEAVAEKLKTFEEILCGQLGCSIAHPLYFINFLCLPNIPHLGITDKGLINTDTMQIIEPIV